jgi:hypothetical protein
VFSTKIPSPHDPNQSEEENAASQQTKLTSLQLKRRAEQVLDQAVSFRIAQVKMCKELGFDCSFETYMRGDNSIVMML